MSEKKKPEKVIGVLGGMGPAASAYFYDLLVQTAQKTYKADQDTDYPAMHIYSLPLSDFDETGVTNTGHVEEQLVDGIKKLDSCGSDFVAIPCNTVHLFHSAMQGAVSIPVLNMIEIVADKANQYAHETVGLLSSHSTRQSKLYENVLAERDIHTLLTTEDEQEQVDQVIHSVMNGSHGAQEEKLLRSIIDRFANEGAQAVIVGCTELPLVLAEKEGFSLPLLDSMQILTETTLAYAYGEK